MTIEKAIYIVEGQKNVHIHPSKRKGWFYYWDEEDQRNYHTTKNRLIEAANWFVEDRLKNDNVDLNADYDKHIRFEEMCAANQKQRKTN